MIDPRRLKVLLTEKQKRETNAKKTPDLLATSFPQQAAFVQDPSKLKAAICTRRAGKSYGSGIMMVQAAIEHPGSRIVYLTYTRQKAKENMEKPLATILRNCNIAFSWKVSVLTFQLENGSEIILRGLNKPEEIEKLRGDHYPLAILDECGHADFNKKLNYIVEEVIEPAVAQHDGTIVLIGTPGNFIDNLFYRVTGPQEQRLPGWSVHHWSWEQNTTYEKVKNSSTIRVCDGIQNLLNRKLQHNPLITETDGYRREWKAEWVIDEDALCYRFNAQRNLIDQLPPGQYIYILGIDLGSNDDTSFVVLAYSLTDKYVYIVETYKEKKMDFHDVANYIKHNLNTRYKFVRYMVDGANLQGVETMRRRFNIPFTCTPKRPGYKFDAIRMMSADLTTGAIKIVAPSNQKLIDEYKKLVWDPNDPTKEKASCANHAADAALYAFLESRHYLAKEPNLKPLDPTEAPPEPVYRFQQDSKTIFDWLDVNLDNL